MQYSLPEDESMSIYQDDKIDAKRQIENEYKKFNNKIKTNKNTIYLCL